MKKALFFVLVLAAFALAACGGGAPAVPTPAPVPADYVGKTSPLTDVAAATAAGAEPMKRRARQKPASISTVMNRVGQKRVTRSAIDTPP